jgi:hypothetical protein
MSSGQLTVLMTTDAVGGVWSYSAGLCTALPEIRFVLATMGPHPRPAQRDEIFILSRSAACERSRIVTVA